MTPEFELEERFTDFHLPLRASELKMLQDLLDELILSGKCPQTLENVRKRTDALKPLVSDGVSCIWCGS